METSKIFNLEAEVELLGAVMKRNDAILEVIDILRPVDFYNTKNQVIYDVMSKLYMSGVSIEITALAEKLGSKLSEVGGITYLTQLLNSSVSARNIKTYAGIIKEKANMRILQRTLQSILHDAQDGDSSTEELRDKLEMELLKIKTNKSSEDGTLGKTIEEFFEKLQERYKNNGDIPGIKTHMKGLDKVLNGLNREDLMILAARPSMGKSAVCANICLNTTLKSKAKVTLFSLEMSKSSLIERMAASVCLIDMNKIKTGKLDDNEWGKIASTVGLLDNEYLRIYDETNNLNGIIAECKKRKLRDGLDVVIIDYLQMIQVTGKFQSREQEVSFISRQLKLMAKELKCTVIALSQLSRNCEQRADHRPMLSDLRESGGIEQDADVVMFLYRDEYYNAETEDKNIIEIIVAKQRNGELGTVKMAWLGNVQLVGDLDFIHSEESARKSDNKNNYKQSPKGATYEGKYPKGQFGR